MIHPYPAVHYSSIVRAGVGQLVRVSERDTSVPEGPEGREAALQIDAFSMKKDISIVDWIDKVEECGERYNWDDLAIRHYALAKLVGVARRWRDSLNRDDQRDWQGWVELLKKNFPCKKSVLSLRLAAQNYKKKPSQDMTEYFYEKLSRCNEADMCSDECIKWIVHGLNSTRFRDFLGPLDRYKEPYELLPHLEAGSAHIRENANGNASGRNESGKRGGNSKDGATSEVTCFACKETGHWKRDCPNKLKSGKCFKCGITGHLARDCGKSQNRSGEISSTTTVSSGNELGSSVVAIRECDATRLGFEMEKGESEALVGYRNGVVLPIGRMTGSLSIDGVEARVDVHVVPDEDQAVPLLVGHPYTEQRHVVITSMADQLLIEERRDTLTTGAVSESVKTVLCAVNSYEVPDNYVGRICVETDFKYTELFVTGDTREAGQLIPRCIVKTDEKGQAVLPVLNLSGAPLKVPEGSVVTRAHKCSEAKVRGREVNDVPVTRIEIDTDLEGEQAERVLALINERLRWRLRQRTTKDLIKELKEAGIVEESCSPYASPMLLVRKASGDIRMCVDFRALNKLSVKDHYPLPRVDDLLGRLGGKKYFTTLDLASGYYQIPVAKDSQPKTLSFWVLRCPTEKISPGTKILSAVKDFPRPTNVGGVRSFVGTATFCRRFIKNFSLIAKPLTDLTAKNAKFEWGPDHQRAFDTLKQRLLEKPVLAIYTPGAETEVHTDASQIGLGAVLFQRQKDGKLHPVFNFSRKTSKDESKYHSYELEALAIVCALERFRVYLIGVIFTIRTDCNSLKLLESKRDLGARIGRWFVRLAEFTYRIEYLKGASNVVADGLSRNPVEPAEELGLVGIPVMGLRVTTDWVAAMQRGSEEIMQIREKLEEGDQDTHERFTMCNARREVPNYQR
ncbi:uncharacterized protein LOC117175411 [Belonocnema kinseyi]|uniref:uncharacterized protein LOC117175411 n=1 Tax=Belonocnema kinseyi TaxID=2817044 RepID=UPI00143D27D5|nr:uncharacterized protein LOC117175411 [Belonocnema kinseyi]